MTINNVEEILAKETRARIRFELKRKESRMNYELKISADLGITYIKVNIPKSLEEIKKAALKLEQEGGVRWVIVDEKDEPKYWCQYIEANLRIDPESTMATDDPYMTKLARKSGFKVISTLDLLRSIGIENPEEKLAKFDMEKVNAKAVLSKMQDLIDREVIELTPSGIDKDKIGKELFGK
jgi:hypothetical protein